jgi:hypothetical protein
VCGADVIWPEAEVHHVKQHSQGGETVIDNGVLVHEHCHPKGATAEEEFARRWSQRRAAPTLAPSPEEVLAAAEDVEDNGET